MQAFHIPAPPPYYTNTFLLISDAGHAVIIDPAADVQNYEQILQEHNAVLTTLLSERIKEGGVSVRGSSTSPLSMPGITRSSRRSAEERRDRAELLACTACMLMTFPP